MVDRPLPWQAAAGRRRRGRCQDEVARPHLFSSALVSFAKAPARQGRLRSTLLVLALREIGTEHVDPTQNVREIA